MSLFTPALSIPPQPYSRPHPRYSNCAFDMFVFCVLFRFSFALLTPKVSRKKNLWLGCVHLHVILTSYSNLSALNKHLDHFFLQKRNTVFARRQFLIRINLVYLGKCFKNKFKNLLFTFAPKCIFKINLLKAMVTQKSLS